MGIIESVLTLLNKLIPNPVVSLRKRIGSFLKDAQERQIKRQVERDNENKP
jgi:hypothetical protein